MHIPPFSKHGDTILIPKKIHFCWLSQDPFPQLILDCMKTWREFLPDYEIVKWDLNRFDASSVKFVQEACENRKWAFASDYIRLFAVHNEGGIYLDSDVRILKSFDPLLKHELFMPIEYHPKIVREREVAKLLDADHRPLIPGQSIPGIGLQAAIFGGVKGHPFLKSCMEFYESQNFIQPDGSFFTSDIAPGIYAKVAEKRGFVYYDRSQSLPDDVSIMESKYFASSPKHSIKEAYAIHCCEGSWREKPQRSFARRAATGIMRRLRGA